MLLSLSAPRFLATSFPVLTSLLFLVIFSLLAPPRAAALTLTAPQHTAAPFHPPVDLPALGRSSSVELQRSARRRSRSATGNAAGRSRSLDTEEQNRKEMIQSTPSHMRIFGREVGFNSNLLISGEHAHEILRIAARRLSSSRSQPIAGFSIELSRNCGGMEELTVVGLNGERRIFASGPSIDLLAFEKVVKSALQAKAKLFIINGLDRYSVLLSFEAKSLIADILRDPSVLLLASIDDEILHNAQARADLGILQESNFFLHRFDHLDESMMIADIRPGNHPNSSASALKETATKLITEVSNVLRHCSGTTVLVGERGRSRSRSVDRSMSPISTSTFEPEEEAWVRSLSTAWQAEVRRSRKLLDQRTAQRTAQLLLRRREIEQQRKDGIFLSREANKIRGSETYRKVIVEPTAMGESESDDSKLAPDSISQIEAD